LRGFKISISGFFNIAMHYFGRVAFAFQVATNDFGQRDGTMAAAGAAERYGEIAFALGNIVRDQIEQQAFDAAEEFAGLREGTDVAGDAGIFAAEFPQVRDEMRIWQKTDIEDQIRIRGNTVAKAEADDRDEQGAAAGILEAIDDELAELVNVEL
jgi:hypothetical protein